MEDRMRIVIISSESGIENLVEADYYIVRGVNLDRKPKGRIIYVDEGLNYEAIFDDVDISFKEDYIEIRSPKGEKDLPIGSNYLIEIDGQDYKVNTL